MNEEQIEKRLRQTCKVQMNALLADGQEEIDVDYDDCEVRIVFGKSSLPGDITITFMDQSCEEEED